MKKYLLIALGIALCIIIAFALYSIGKKNGITFGINKQTSEQNQKSNQYDLLAKRIFIEDSNDIRVNFSNLRSKLNNYFASNNLSGGNLYFEYLPTGTSIRISGDEHLVAASLMKVPVAMNAYKAAELGKIDLQKAVTIKPEWLDQNYGQLYKKGAGYRISIEDAIEIMLKDSDNTALRLVGAQTDGLLPKEESSLNYVDIDLTVNDDSSISLDSKNYSSLLKCLYFACYNNLRDSQTLLDHLTNSSFKSRLAAGITDKNIKVAHKIGTNSNNNQSDCGIFYVPKRNYVVCAMIPGNDSKETNAHFVNISKIIYDYINQ
ncbi:serine hydrolase [Candidatus Saccharibacteria bacterium]|nr:serine hydrolase [Candidatus Saccharibacteria bacterium]